MPSKWTTFIFLLAIFDFSCSSRITIDRLSIRHLKKNDIGLIFDAVISNRESEPKETLSFEVKSEKCCLLINGTYDCDTQNVIGTKVENFEPGKVIIVSLLWPTLILFNRIGNCTINVITHRPLGTQIDDTRLIHFNTTINSERIADFMLYYFNDMKIKYGYEKCESDDLNPFDKCKPFNCELKYFGKRNFFKHPNCVPTKVCLNDPNVIYDYETNSCRDLKKVFTDNEVKKLETGQFDNWIEKFDAPSSRKENNVKLDRVLRRARRSLNESQTFADMIIASMLFVIKIAVLVVFVYLMMALLISILFYLCIGCGVISNSVTMNAFERFE